MHGERRNEVRFVLRPALDLNAKLPFLVTWCPRSESNRHAFKGGGFSYHFGFRRPAALGTRVRSLEHAFTVASWALGARRLLSTPSPGAPGAWLGISSRRVASGPSPSLTGFTAGISPRGLKLLV